MKDERMKLTSEEKDILTSFDEGEWISVKSVAVERKKSIEIARATMRKDKDCNNSVLSRPH